MPTRSPYPELTQALRILGVNHAIDWGLSDYIVCIPLPDDRDMVISPPQEPSEPHPPRAWTLDLHDRQSGHQQVLYDSTPTGPQAEHAGSITALLHAVRSNLPAT